tara:strand:+ start:684 stop:1166 length:483 start_codon:yes stop_codon:yes gene_type:complete
MATTATNKQPLLVDRVFHNVVKGNTLTSGSATSLNIEGTNESNILVDCTSSDGGIVEDLYVIARSTTAYKALFFFSSSVDYLRPAEALYVGQITSSTTAAVHTSCTTLPKILAPLPHQGSDAQLKALYVPKGQALWCSLQLAGPANSDNTPIIGAQGGFY